MLPRDRKIHFVGIGGSGMSGIAEVLLNLGFQVTGSDLKSSQVTKRLEDLGGGIFYSHERGNINNADVVVMSSAVAYDNPEIIAALEKKVPVIPRAEMLAEIMRMKSGIAIAGSHGKTTTTSFIGSILVKAEMDPTIVNGGIFNSLGTNAKLGQGDYFVAEADESDGSFLLLSPVFAIVTNIDLEHLDYYRDLDHIKDTYLRFINKVPFYGSSIICLDEPNIQSIIPRIKKKFITYGLKTQADMVAKNIQIEPMNIQFDVFYHDKNLGKFSLHAAGIHNVDNALAAITCALELGIDIEKIRETLLEFKGVKRRFQIKAEIGGIMIIDDYGHHPTEIEATLNAARTGWGRRIVLAFQPHRFTRTKALLEQFGRCFYQADELIIGPIYPAGEKPIPGITGESIVESAKKYGQKNVRYIPEKNKILEYILSIVRQGDMVFTMGAGDIWEVGENLIEKLKYRNFIFMPK
ncbi:MAG: UDP-N-acetylmuramate--L-alanine ligase [bacterium]